MTRALDAFDIQRLGLQHLPVKKQQRVERLVLGRSRDFLVHRQVGKERAHMLGIQFFWVPLAVIKDIALNPGAIRFLGAQAEMPEASNIAHLIQQLSLHHH